MFSIIETIQKVELEKKILIFLDIVHLISGALPEPASKLFFAFAVFTKSEHVCWNLLALHDNLSHELMGLVTPTYQIHNSSFFLY